MVYDLTEARNRRAEVRAGYTNPYHAYAQRKEAEWRAAWASHCVETGKTVSFDEWFFAACYEDEMKSQC